MTDTIPGDIIVTSTKPYKFTAVSLFCGAGGLDLGFERQGFKTIWANDINKDAVETMRAWCDDARIVCGDISKISSLMIPKADVFLGGFPCQGFSSAGNREVDDSRNTLYKQYVRVLKAVKPYVFVGENVEGLLTMLDGAVIDKVISDFNQVGYNVTYYKVNASDYGIPQERHRVILLGIRKDLPPTFPVIPTLELKTMRDILWGLPDPDQDDIHWGNFSPRYMARNRRRDWDDVSYTIPASMRHCPLHPSSPEMYRDTQGERYEGRVVWHFGDGMTRRFAWWEAALIQSFPVGMRFVGGLESKYRQVGNAVPPLLAEVFAKEIYKYLNNVGVSNNISMF